MKSNNLSYIGLAYRAGKTLVGSAACENGIKRNKIKLLLLNNSLSAGSIGSFKKKCERNDVPVIQTDEQIGKAIGREEVKVIGITDEGLASTIRNMVDIGKGSGIV